MAWTFTGQKNHGPSYQLNIQMPMKTKNKLFNTVTYYVKLNQCNKCSMYICTLMWTTGCGRKKWTPKFFRRFLSNRLGF